MVMVASATVRSYVIVVLGWLKERGGEVDMSRHHATVHGSVPMPAVWSWCACAPWARNTSSASSSLDGVAVAMATCTNNREVWLPRQHACGAVLEQRVVLKGFALASRKSSAWLGARPW
jgi:hypothetical protein